MAQVSNEVTIQVNVIQLVYCCQCLYPAAGVFDVKLQLIRVISVKYPLVCPAHALGDEKMHVNFTDYRMARMFYGGKF